MEVHDHLACGTSCRFGRGQRTWLLKTVLPEQLSRAMGASVEEYEPCTETWSNTYLNLEDVKAAIHVNTSITWEVQQLS
jgi:hypothetical protein